MKFGGKWQKAQFEFGGKRQKVRFKFGGKWQCVDIHLFIQFYFLSLFKDLKTLVYE